MRHNLVYTCRQRRKTAFYEVRLLKSRFPVIKSNRDDPSVGPETFRRPCDTVWYTRVDSDEKVFSYELRRVKSPLAVIESKRDHPSEYPVTFRRRVRHSLVYKCRQCRKNPS